MCNKIEKTKRNKNKLYSDKKKNVITIYRFIQHHKYLKNIFQKYIKQHTRSTMKNRFILGDRPKTAVAKSKIPNFKNLRSLPSKKTHSHTLTLLNSRLIYILFSSKQD